MHTIIVNNEKYRWFTQSYIVKYTGCQCFKDCNCADEKPKLISKKWYRNIKFDNTNKAFYSKPYTPIQYN